MTEVAVQTSSPMIEAHANGVWNIHPVRLLEQSEAGAWAPVADGWWNYYAPRKLVTTDGEELPFIALEAQSSPSMAPADLIHAWQGAGEGYSEPVKIKQFLAGPDGQVYFDADHDCGAWRYLKVSVRR